MKSFLLLTLLVAAPLTAHAAPATPSQARNTPNAQYAAKVATLFKTWTPTMKNYQSLFERERGLQLQKKGGQISQAAYAKKAVTRAEWQEAIAGMHTIAKEFRSISPVPPAQKPANAQFLVFSRSLDSSMNTMSRWVETRNNSLITQVAADMRKAMDATLAGAKAMKR